MSTPVCTYVYTINFAVHVLYTCADSVPGMCVFGGRQRALQVLVAIHLVKDIIGYLV